MKTTILNIETICTDEDLANRGGGAALLSRARPSGVASFAIERARALEDVLDNLAARTPPVYDSDLVDPSELQAAVAYRALTMIAENAATADGDAWSFRARGWRKDAADAIRTLRPTVTGGEQAPPMSIKLSRR